jgi:hypothetical protein
MWVKISIFFEAKHSFGAMQLSEIIWNSCQICFEYALQSSHPKTIVTALHDGAMRPFGELVATFRPQGYSKPIGA